MLHQGPRGSDIEPVSAQLDPIVNLPPELSMRCIIESLPHENRLYAASVLQLMTVSQKWQDFIATTPVIWTYIHIDARLQDLLATVAAFAKLSGTMPIKLTIWDDPDVLLRDISSILLEHSSRIAHIVINTDIRLIQTEEHNGRYVSLASRVLQYLEAPTLVTLEFNGQIHVNDIGLNSLEIPSNARIKSRIRCSMLQRGEINKAFDDIITSTSIDQIIPAIGSLACSTLYLGDVVPTQGTHSVTPILKKGSPRLRSLTYRQPYGDSVRRLLQLCGQQLSRLAIEIPVSVIMDIINILPSLVGLQQLILDISDWTNHQVTSRLPYPSTRYGLQNLILRSVKTERMSRYDPGPFIELFAAFTAMYSGVTDVGLYGISDIIDFAGTFLQSLTNLESLATGRNESQPLYEPVPLSSLQRLSISVPTSLSSFRTPNLFYLSVRNVTSSTELAQLHLQQLRKLIIFADPELLELSLNPTEYPELRELTIFPSRPALGETWQLASFPRLTMISLGASRNNRWRGSRLCVELIYSPEMCPSLESVKFYDPVEWDLLFIMLERRNYRLKDVNKITTVVLPFVPFSFQASLDALLDGRPRSSEPSYLDLSMEAIREETCDPDMCETFVAFVSILTHFPRAGCILCIMERRPKCLLLPRKGRNVTYKHGLFCGLPNPPSTLPSEIRDWFMTRNQLADLWNRSFDGFESQYTRILRCSLR